MRLAMITLLIGADLYAGPVEFTGSVGVSGEQSWVSGDTLIEPLKDLMLTINPSVSLWGFPIGLDVLVSTQESNLRQQLNKFRLFLDPKGWLESQADLSGLALSLKGVELGSCNPSYSPLTLSGTTVYGAAVELSPWKLYLAGAAGRTQRAVNASDSTEAAFSQMLYAGKLGYGEKEGTHFYLTGLYAKDDPNSLAINTRPDTTITEEGDTLVDSLEVITPQENYLLGMELNLYLADGLFTLESEASAIELSRDTRMPVLEEDWVRQYGLGFLHIRWCSQFDFAYKVRPALNVLDTRVYGEVQMVGPGYQSLGAPSLRNDNLTFRGGIEREFLDGAITVAASGATEQDNLIGMKLSTTRFTSYAFDLGLNFTGLPYLQASYTPYSEQSGDLASRADIASLSIGHSFLTGSLTQSPSLSASWQNCHASLAEDDYTSIDLGLYHSVGFGFPLSISASAGLGQAAYAQETDRAVYFDLAPSYTLFDAWTNTLTLGGSFGGGTRYDVRLSSSFPVWKLCDASLGIEENIYSGSDGKYNEFRLFSSLTRSW